LADNGTLFLDEIGELPMTMQSNLLRVLQSGTFERVGGNQTLSVDVRIIAATNRDLEKMIKDGTFREDLYYRLNVFPIYNIPLRKRVADIPLLAAFFVEKYAKKMNRSVHKIHPDDMARLKAYDYPGNIRELENIIERGIILSTGSTLNLDLWRPKKSVNPNATDSSFPTLETLQKQHIEKALERCKWKVSGKNGAAALLGMKDQTLFSRMRKYGISRS
ncbi:MAG: sigma 54-interacting transcriptional regulator, partial [Bacteroidota bacterium]